VIKQMFDQQVMCYIVGKGIQFLKHSALSDRAQAIL